MSEWSLKTLLSELHDNIQQELSSVRKSVEHPTTKGDASEEVWLDLLNNYLPHRYKAERAHIIDSKDQISRQIDIVIFDRQYTPFIFQIKNQKVIPAESVYAVFEVKQTINAENIKYAKEVIRSVRKLHRTSLPIPYAKGVYPAKPLIPIYGGILALDSDWACKLGQPLMELLNDSTEDDRIDLGCVASFGYFKFESEKGYLVQESNKAATAFLFELISTLQFSGTVPMIDVNAYSKWLFDHND